MSDIGKGLKERREELDLTLEQVGDRVGVGKSTVRKWEMGNIKNMGRSNIAKLSEALHISPLYILGLIADYHEIVDVSIADEKKIRLLNDFDCLNNSGKDEAIKQVNHLTYIPEYSDEDSEDTNIIPFIQQMKEAASNEPVLMAAHNDHAEDPEEIEKMRRDAERLAALQKND